MDSTKRLIYVGALTSMFALTLVVLDTTPVSATALPPESNSAPVATNSTATTEQGTAIDIPLQAVDAEGDELGYSTVNNPSNGTITSISNNIAHYVPSPSFTGSDAFTFRATDVFGLQSNIAVVRITVNSHPQCHDGLDNDTDTLVDIADPSCHTDFNATNEDSYNQSLDDESVVDVCSNITGIQRTIPEGYSATEGVCVLQQIVSGGGSTTTVSGGRSSGGGGGRSSTVPTSTEKVLGATCGLYIEKHLRRGAKNDSQQTSKLQQFLNKELGTGLPTSGYYGPLTESAVKKFQVKYSNEILKPWGISAPTGLVYLSTLRQVNYLECPDAAGELPALVDWSKNSKAQ